MHSILSRKIISYVLGALLFLLLFAAIPGQQDHPEEDSQAALTEDTHSGTDLAEESFSPSHFVFDHILDAYEWHILSYKDFHLSIPLPVIIYSETKGLNALMFNKFHHGH